MKPAGVIGFFKDLVREWSATSEKLDELEKALIERAKLDKTLPNEEKLSLVRDLRYLTLYLSKLEYNEDQSSTRAILEVYGPYVTGYINVLVTIPFEISQLSINNLTSMLINVGTENRYPVTALASILWTFTMKGWDSDFVEWFKNENVKGNVRQYWSQLTTTIEYERDFQIKLPEARMKYI